MKNSGNNEKGIKNDGRYGVMNAAKTTGETKVNGDPMESAENEIHLKA